MEQAACADASVVLGLLGSSESGLSADEASLRLREGGPNAVLSHGARPLRVLVRQLRSPLLILLVGPPRSRSWSGSARPRSSSSSSSASRSVWVSSMSTARRRRSSSCTRPSVTRR
ncbi:cation-transporting P-type ATPase [Candidatus Nephthysia bennettiae]|uniref:cation-transporting P-type ATPase n=1 Tax=Candidatus Nephthysia bennettiae TaxID=3127016 RepID=UPI003312FC31